MSEHEGNTTPAETQEKVSEKIKKKGRKEVAKKNKVLESLDIQYINVNDIHPNEWNPNRQSEHDFELLLKSSIMFPLLGPAEISASLKDWKEPLF